MLNPVTFNEDALTPPANVVEPMTSSLFWGAVVPMPTFPELETNKSPLLPNADVIFKVPRICRVWEGFDALILIVGAAIGPWDNKPL
ncbi:hypothetical protein HYV80_01410 [Candidatus Woesearchaeota archaeon]|nr:hypothetical protein [Candidatus Woesearchaeota archaeon]